MLAMVSDFAASQNSSASAARLGLLSMFGSGFAGINKLAEEQGL